MSEFQTSKADLSTGRIVETDMPSIRRGEVLAKVDRYAFTANNVTYAAMGDHLRYWEFFRPQGESPQDWGIIPVWGFADVVESQSDDVPVGDRLFGYFPPATYLSMTPSNVSGTAFIEASEHRKSLPVSYNQYRRVNNEPGYDKATDNERMLLFVLHLTSFCLHDMLSSNNWYDAEQVVIISASSKTSTGLAYGLAADQAAPSIVGLTSKRNTELVNSINVYDSVHSYDDLEHIDANKATVIVDMSGDSPILSRLHSHLGANMRFCSNVGFTHWDEPQSADGIITERSKMFFAPTHIQTRIKEWGNAEFDKKSMQFIMHSFAKSRQWMQMTELDGLRGLATKYKDIVDGNVPADQGLIVIM